MSATLTTSERNFRGLPFKLEPGRCLRALGAVSLDLSRDHEDPEDHDAARVAQREEECRRRGSD
eukprot:3870918-Rhodomonas_salina.2